MTAPMAFVNRYFVWDTESTGNKPTDDHVISLGGVLCNYVNGKFESIEEFHTYIHTDRQIDPAAQSVHHISKSMLQGQPSFLEAMRLLRNWLIQRQPEPLSRLIFIAHNGSKFDNIIIYCNFVQNRLNFDDFLRDIKCYGFIDTLKVLRQLFKDCTYKEMPKDAATGRQSFALGHCYASFCSGGLSLENAHDALVDSQALVAVLNSVSVSCKINLQLLFKCMTNKQKELNWIKQTAGVSFSNREQETRQRKEKEKEVVQSEKKEVMKHEPMFTDGDLCLNCMTFVDISQHKTCEELPTSLISHQESEENFEDLDKDEDDAFLDAEINV